MVEKVVTGGLMDFHYQKNTPQLKKEEKEEIELAYDKYYARREKERKRKRIIWGVVVLIAILVLIGVWLYTRN